MTPPGTSLVAKTSANVMAQVGLFSEAKTMHVFPPTMQGAITEIRPNNAVDSSAIMATTPIGSGTEKLKCDVATGLTELCNC